MVIYEKEKLGKKKRKLRTSNVHSKMKCINDHGKA